MYGHKLTLYHLVADLFIEFKSFSSSHSCLNGADENDCMSIYGHKMGQGYSDFNEHSEKFTIPKLPSHDAFGRSKTQADGYVYFTSHGKDYLYW